MASTQTTHTLVKSTADFMYSLHSSTLSVLRMTLKHINCYGPDLFVL